ncbi:UDP-galactopyranose mutase [Coraliomargarita parva]|uniref:UDP-galactopyranose mutase n=1 Tax=Coraliomargarita parva TaxID=3014050 RepID=UPI0022B32E81|nr:UDP-galactopyranose mutase [Coraliomargarita parva]
MGKKFLIVGAGMYGSVCARELTDAGHHCHVIEKRDHIGGNCYTRYNEEADCHQHVYGAHIFHTNSQRIWNYVNGFAEFNHYRNSPRVSYKDRIFSFPINLLTFHQLYGCRTPQEAENKLREIVIPNDTPQNMEEWCLANVGPDIYEIFIKGYTTKQWNRSPQELPADIIKRLPFRLTFDDNYFTDRYQGIPTGGYTAIFERLLEGSEVSLETDFLADRDEWIRRYDHVIYTGPLDAFFGYCHGHLEYRSLRFESSLLPVRNYQGNAVFNYTDTEVPYTRTYEHKHFDMNLNREKTLVTWEYPHNWKPGDIEYYPVQTTGKNNILATYTALRNELDFPITFGGRLAEFRYYDMHQVIGAALKQVHSLLSI